MGNPLDVLRSLFDEDELDKPISPFQAVIEAGLRGAAEPESLAESGRTLDESVDLETAEQLRKKPELQTGALAGLVSLSEFSQEEQRRRLGLKKIDTPQDLVVPKAVPFELEKSAGSKVARAIAFGAPLLFGAGPAVAAKTAAVRGGLGALENVAQVASPETTPLELGLVASAGFAGGALLGPRGGSKLAAAGARRLLQQSTDPVGEANLLRRFGKLRLRDDVAKSLPSGARAAKGDLPFRRLKGDPQFQADTVVKDHFKKDYGFSDAKTRKFMERLSPGERSDMAVEVSQSKMQALAKTVRTADVAPEAVEKTLLRLPAPRSPISDDAGFAQFERLIDSAPDGAGVLRPALDRAKKATTGNRVRNLPVQSLILNSYMSNPTGRLRDFVVTAGNTLVQAGTAAARSRSFHTFHGFGDAIKNSWLSASEGWRTGINRELREVIRNGELPKSAIDELQRLGRVTPEFAKQLRAGGTAIPEELLEGVVMLKQGNNLSDILSRLPFTPGRFNAAQDDFFTTMAFFMQSNARAAQKTAAEGVSGGQFGKRFIANQANLSDQELEAAWETARRVSFREKNVNGITEGVIDAGRWTRNKIPFIGPYVIAPFVRTPTIIAQRSLEYNPMNAMLGGVQWLFGKAPSSRSVGKLRFQKGMVGLSGVVAFSEAAKMGVITGNGEHLDRAEKDTLIRAGRWAPNSIKIGDTWVRYTGLGPISALLSLSSGLVEKSKAGQMNSVEDIAANFGILSGEAALDATFLPGAHRFLDAILKGRRSGESFIDQASRVFQPIGLLSQVARAIDPRKVEPVGFEEEFASRVPGLRADVPERGRQTFAESPEVGPVGRFLNPSTVRSTDPTINFLADRGIFIGRPTVTRFKEKADRQKFRFNKKEGNAIQLAKGRSQRAAVEKVLSNPLFTTLSVERQTIIIKREIRKSNTQIDEAVRARKRKGIPIDFRSLQ